MTQLLTDSETFREYCDSLRQEPWIAFDTEFVGEDYYRPKLCLIQVATPSGIQIIDALALENVDLFWKVLTEGDHVTLLHAGQHELRFCLNSVDQRPKNLFDIQVASGLMGMDYPASYSNLVARILKINIKKSQSRTDWRRRPLNSAQLSYAAADVEHLHPIYLKLAEKLKSRDRLHCLADEMAEMEKKCRQAESDERWKRVSGINGLNPRELAVLRSVWSWREEYAAEFDKPAKRILRDDLMVEVARLSSKSESKIKSIRQMTQPRFDRHVPAIASQVEKALNLSESELPDRIGRSRSAHYGLAGQFLHVILSSLCRKNSISPALVASVQDINDLIEFVDKPKKSKKAPKLTKGWRGEMFGNRLQQALNGGIGIRIVKKKNEFVPIIDES